MMNYNCDNQKEFTLYFTPVKLKWYKKILQKLHIKNYYVPLTKLSDSLFDMSSIKSFEQLKKEFGKDYDKLMYDMNLELMRELNNKELEIYELKKIVED